MPGVGRLAPVLVQKPRLVSEGCNSVDNEAVKGAQGLRLERLRQKQGLTRSDFADALGVSIPTVWAWEKGRCRPRKQRLAAIADLLGIDPEELAGAALPHENVGKIDPTGIIEQCREKIADSFGVKKAFVRIIVEINV